MTCFLRNSLINETEQQSSPVLSISDFYLFLALLTHRKLHWCITLLEML